MSIEETETPTAEIEAPSVPDDVAAFAKGAEAVNETKPEPVAAEKPAEVAGATGAAPEAPGATAAAEPNEQEKAAAKLKADDDAEIKKLGIKNEGAAARFRELNAEARKVPELTKQLETMKPLAEEAERFNAIIADTKAKPEQIGAMLKYLKAINSQEPDAMNSAADQLLNECKAVFKFLGRELPAFDPVMDHDDLKQALEAGGTTPELAREAARARALQKHNDARAQAQRDEETRVADYNKAVSDGVQALTTLGVNLQKMDPQYADKLAVMKEAGTIDTIKDEVHPSRWADAFQKAFAKVTVKAPPPKPGNMPLRPTGADPNAQRRAPKDDYEAFSIGAASVR